MDAERIGFYVRVGAVLMDAERVGQESEIWQVAA